MGRRAGKSGYDLPRRFESTSFTLTSISCGIESSLSSCWENGTLVGGNLPQRVTSTLFSELLLCVPLLKIMDSKITLMPKKHILEWHFPVCTQQVQRQSPYVTQRMQNSARDAGQWNKWFQKQTRTQH